MEESVPGRVRVERDSLGQVEVPAERLWGAQTQRSLVHFRISGERMPRALVQALVRVKQAVAQVIMNRVRLNYYPNTICGVVYEGADRLNSCQFSFACDRRADVPKEKREWEIANEVAQVKLKRWPFVPANGNGHGGRSS